MGSVCVVHFGWIWVKVGMYDVLPPLLVLFFVNIPCEVIFLLFINQPIASQAIYLPQIIYCFNSLNVNMMLVSFPQLSSLF